MELEFRQKAEAAKFALQLVLGFFARVEGKSSVVLALNTGMLAVLTANLPPANQFQWRMLLAILPVSLIFSSYWHLFRAAYPDLKGGTASLIYFREIAKRKESQFIDEFSAQ